MNFFLVCTLLLYYSLMLPGFEPGISILKPSPTQKIKIKSITHNFSELRVLVCYNKLPILNKLWDNLFVTCWLASSQIR